MGNITAELEEEVDMANAWFRFYSETLRDRKMERLSRISNQPKALLVGIWVTFLSLANDSPIPGALLLTEDIPLDLDDFAMETGMSDGEILNSIVASLIDLKMLTVIDGVYYITNWEKRQFKSDNSAERVRNCREKAEKQNDASQDVVTETTTDRYSNDDVTPSDTEADTDTDSETETDSEKTISSAFADYQALRLLWLELFPEKPKPRANNKTLQTKLKTRLKSQHFRENWEAALRRAATSSFCNQESWFDLEWFLKNDTHYESCLNGKYDDKPGFGGGVGKKLPQPPREKKRYIIHNASTGEDEEVIA
jgi:hypothetical protein